MVRSRLFSPKWFDMCHFPHAVRDNEKIVLAFVKESGNAARNLKRASERCRDVHEIVLAAHAVPPLIKLLPLRHAPTQEAAARALKNLAFAPGGAELIAKAGGTPPLVRLLKSGSDDLHSAAEAALEVLTMQASMRDRLDGTLRPRSRTSTE